MTRREERESVFCLCFEYSLNQAPMEELIELAALCRDLEVTPYVEKTVYGIVEKRREIDEILLKHSKGWKIERMPKVSLAILRLAVYEMFFAEDIPENAAINEAVELAKKFDAEDGPAFINGVLGAISRDRKNG